MSQGCPGFWSGAGAGGWALDWRLPHTLATSVVGFADGCPHLHHELVWKGELSQNGVQAACEGLGSRRAPSSFHHRGCCGTGWASKRDGRADGGTGRTDRLSVSSSACFRLPPPSPVPGTPRLPAPLTQLRVSDSHVALQQVVHPARRCCFHVAGLRTGEWPNG